MKRTLLGSAIVFAAVAVAGAQSQSTGTTPSSTTTQSSSSYDRSTTDQASTITLVGCVQQQEGAGSDEFLLANASAQPEGSMASSGASSSSASSSPPSSSSTSPSSTSPSSTSPSSTSPSSSSPSATGTSGTTTGSTSLSGSGAKAYELTGDREDELKQYVGQQVEITGTVDRHDAGMTSSSSTSGSENVRPGETASSPSSQTAASGGVGTSGAAGDNSRALPRLKITSFRVIGGTCNASGGAR